MVVKIKSSTRPKIEAVYIRACTAVQLEIRTYMGAENNLRRMGGWGGGGGGGTIRHYNLGARHQCLGPWNQLQDSISHLFGLSREGTEEYMLHKSYQQTVTCYLCSYQWIKSPTTPLTRYIGSNIGDFPVLAIQGRGIRAVARNPPEEERQETCDRPHPAICSIDSVHKI